VTAIRSSAVDLADRLRIVVDSTADIVDAPVATASIPDIEALGSMP
jgi:hypothetical protein